MKKIILISFFFLGCYHSDKQISEKQPYLLDSKLEKELLNYIERNKLDCHCSVMIDYFNLNNGYKILNFTNTRNSRLVYSEIVPKTKIGCINIYFFTGVEEYFKVANISKSIKVEGVKPCGNDDIMIIDSLGNFTTHRDIILFPDCKIPKDSR